MPRPRDPNSRTTPITIKVTRAEADKLRILGGGSPGKGLRRALNAYWRQAPHRSE